MEAAGLAEDTGEASPDSACAAASTAATAAAPDLMTSPGTPALGGTTAAGEHTSTVAQRYIKLHGHDVLNCWQKRCGTRWDTAITPASMCVGCSLHAFNSTSAMAMPNVKSKCIMRNCPLPSQRPPAPLAVPVCPPMPPLLAAGQATRALVPLVSCSHGNVCS